MSAKRLITLTEEVLLEIDGEPEIPLPILAQPGQVVPTTTIFPDGKTTSVSEFQMTIFTPQGAILLTKHPMPYGPTPVRPGDSIKFTYEVKFNREGVA